MDQPAKEPLYVGDETSGYVDGFAIHCQKAAPHHFVPLYAIAFSEEDARRIVACVNACAGMATDYLEDVAQSGRAVDPSLLAYAARRRMGEIEAHRAQLQAALSATVGQRDLLLALLKLAHGRACERLSITEDIAIKDAITALEQPKEGGAA